MTPGPENRIPPEQMQVIIYNTIGVLTGLPGLAEWLALMEQAQAQAAQYGSLPEQEFFAALVALLHGRPAALPEGHPYAAMLQLVLDGLASAREAIGKASQAGEAVEAAAAGSNGKHSLAGEPDVLAQAVSGAPGEAGPPPDGRLFGLPPELEPYVNAVTALLDAPDWPAALALVQRHQALLFDPRADQVFAVFLARAGESGDQQAVDYIANHRAFVEACKRDGFDAMAGRLG